MTTLTAANAARLEHVLNKWRRDAVTRELYTIQQRLDRGAYAYKVSEIEGGKTTGYGLVLHAEMGPTLDYIGTEVCNTPKMVFDHVDLPTAVLNHDTMTLKAL